MSQRAGMNRVEVKLRKGRHVELQAYDGSLQSKVSITSGAPELSAGSGLSLLGVADVEDV